MKLLLLIATILIAAVHVAPAMGAASDPLLVLVPEKPKEPKEKPNPGPTGYFDAVCGLAVASSGNVSISDYYHHVIDTLEPNVKAPKFLSQITNVDPLDGPCGLTFDAAGHLWVNNFRHNVEDLTGGIALELPSEDTEHHLPTGVAFDPTTERIYVNNRSYVTAFEQDGTQVMNGLSPLQIGAGNLGDAYGLAVSAFPGTAGRIYVPDSVSKTVKVFDPSVSTVAPVATIGGPGKGFTSLQDAAVAVDRVTGVVYVTDNLQPVYTESPEAAVDVFSSAGAFLGVLKFKVFDALPPGLAVDNTASVATQGRVYVTSGNNDKAGLYVYGPGAQTNGFLPPSVGAVVHTGGNGGGVVSNSLARSPDCAGTCTVEPLAGSSVTFTAIPDPGSKFDGWSGACSGDSESCTVKMDESSSLGASFSSTEVGVRGGETPPAVEPDTSQEPSHATRRHHRSRRHHHRARHRHRKGAHRHRVGHRR